MDLEKIIQRLIDFGTWDMPKWAIKIYKVICPLDWCPKTFLGRLLYVVLFIPATILCYIYTFLYLIFIISSIWILVVLLAVVLGFKKIYQYVVDEPEI